MNECDQQIDLLSFQITSLCSSLVMWHHLWCNSEDSSPQGWVGVKDATAHAEKYSHGGSDIIMIKAGSYTVPENLRSTACTWRIVSLTSCLSWYHTTCHLVISSAGLMIVLAVVKLLYHGPAKFQSQTVTPSRGTHGSPPIKRNIMETSFRES